MTWQWFVNFMWPTILAGVAGYQWSRARWIERRLRKVTVAAAVMLDAYELGQDNGDIVLSAREQDELLLKQDAAYRASKYMTHVYGEPRGRSLSAKDVMMALVETQEEMK